MQKKGTRETPARHRQTGAKPRRTARWSRHGSGEEEGAGHAGPHTQPPISRSLARGSLPEGVAGCPGAAQLVAALPFAAANPLVHHRAVVAGRVAEEAGGGALEPRPAHLERVLADKVERLGLVGLGGPLEHVVCRG